MIGLLALSGILLLVAAAVGGLAMEAGGLALVAEWNRAGTRSIIRFTLWQATLSTVISVAAAVPLARALARRTHFPGRAFILRLSSVSLVIPSMVAVLGIVAVHGHSGWLNHALGGVGLGPYRYLYGLGGILIAHVFFNLPLATRIFLNGLSAIPQYSWDLARLYGMRPHHMFRLIEWPLLRPLLAPVAGMIFLLCFTSFAIVLTLGGGPRATTLEVAIFQAVRFDFDLSRAVALSVIQIGLCGALAFGFFAAHSPFPLRAGDAAGGDRPHRAALLGRVVDSVVIAAAAAFLLSPLAAVLAKAATPAGWGILAAPSLWRACGYTVFIALCAGALSCALALPVSGAIVTLRQRRWRGVGVVEVIGALTLIVPPITLGTGLFLLARRFTDALSLGLPLVIALNALLTLAFGIRILTPALQLQRNRYDPLCASLGIRGRHRWRHILWPPLRAPITYTLAIATTLSAGDMGVIALFGTDRLSTLPLLMYRLMGSYQTAAAAVTALLLCLLCLALFWGIERLGGARPEHA